MNNDPLISAEKQHVWHPFTQMQAWCAPDHEPIVLVEGQGSILWDSHGREYIDGNSSIWTNIHGHNHPVINAAIKSQLDKVAHVSFLGSTNAPAIELAQKLAGCFPSGSLTRTFYSDDGSTAVEVAVKMAVQYWQLRGRPEKCRFVAFENAYHGDTTGAASLGGVDTFTSRFASIHFPVERAANLDAISSLTPDCLAAVIVEPLVQGAAGIRLWPPGMLRSLRAWCDANDVLLIFDEVLTGFGRTGRLFACEHESVLPDFLCLAKGLSGGYLPLAATLTTEGVYEAFLGEYQELKTFFYGHSYCGNALGCAAALANLEIFEEENVLESLKGKIALLKQLLAGLRKLPNVAETRQCGMIAGIEVRRSCGERFPWQEQTGARVCIAARKYGLLTRPIMDTIVLIPPLCITGAQLERATEAIQRAIQDVCETSGL
ncbi:MAG TPA: adenosylmethionine--8-amino-7-oxononanoate transaminase [Terrimicrobiaceae bacterium]|nr:adenosylmethionine--8-amino-7-oxononanoate transaminase [Terrimicrobiaceae bacterium]